MKYDIGIVYQDDMPEQLVLDLAKDLREANVEVEIEKRPNVPFIALEWAIPTAIIVYLAKPYIDSFLKEAGKDHYLIVKEKLTKFAQKVLKIRRRTIVSSQSPNKVSKDNPVSSSFSLCSITIDGRPLKFLFLGDREDDYYEYCINEIFSVLLNHAQEFPDDYISNQADRLPRRSRDIYMFFDESAKKWKAVDIVTGILADGSDAI
jgi:hypothetical protein